MPEKPSYLTSTTSQLLVISIAGYMLGSLLLIWKGGGTLDPIKWLIELLLPLYGVRTGANAVMRMMATPPTPNEPPAPVPTTP